MIFLILPNISDNGLTLIPSIDPIGHKPYVCTDCDKRFASQTQSNNHILTHKIHTGDKPYLCYGCDSKFATVRDLKMHMLTHNSKTSFSCPECDYACNDTVLLKQHIDMHTGGWSFPIFNGKPLKPKTLN